VRNLMAATITERQGWPGAASAFAGRAVPAGQGSRRPARVPGAPRPPAGLRRFVPAVVLADDEQARVLAAAERAGVVTAGRCPGPDRAKPSEGMMRSVSP
jgi:hypothetical protein